MKALSAWRTPAGHFLILEEVEPIPMHTPIPLPDGETIWESGRYVELDARGARLKVFLGPSVYSLDDTLGISDIHRVIADKLISFHWIDHGSAEPVLKATVEISGLQACSLDELQFEQ